jgi:pimeloyl-ACP methyl ester carboxylesterase
MDENFTPNPGLREFKNGVLTGAVPVQKGRILLFVHGTFSNNDNLFNELRSTGEGQQFLADITKHANGAGVNYDQVLTFDHYTVSRSPVLNAFELARIMAVSTANVDIICHSRGGLVTRWFMEVFDRVDRSRRRAVLVGSPLRGTSLAAPDRVRNGIHLFANIGKTIGQGLSLIPFAQVAGFLMQIVFSFGDAVSKTPMVNAAVAMIPGLAAMSRVGNNFELDTLKDRTNLAPEYSAVTSIFKGEDIGWKFWKVFCGFEQRVAEAADTLIFRDADGTPSKNDLVVDTTSMTEYGFPSTGVVKAFGENDHVYHTIYFRHPGTIHFIRERLGIA